MVPCVVRHKLCWGKARVGKHTLVRASYRGWNEENITEYETNDGRLEVGAGHHDPNINLVQFTNPKHSIINNSLERHNYSEILSHCRYQNKSVVYECLTKYIIVREERIIRFYLQ